VGLTCAEKGKGARGAQEVKQAYLGNIFTGKETCFKKIVGFDLVKIKGVQKRLKCNRSTKKKNTEIKVGV